MSRRDNGRHSESRRAVVKIGTATLTDERGRPDREYIADLCSQVVRARDAGWQICLVSSGAIRAGMIRLQMKRRPRLIPEKQAAAAVGQGLLMDMYASEFDRFGTAAAQVLLTRDDFSDRTRYLNARNTLLTLLRFRAVPVINENDTVSVEEIRFGDNDMLAALVGTLVDADLVLLLTDVPGLCTGKPGGGRDVELIREVREITPELMQIAGAGESERGGTGGMSSKLAAAQVAMAAGIALTVAQGREPRVVERVLAGEELGTRFLPGTSRLNSRKRWMAFAVPARGSLRVNEGAARMLATRRASLLPVGIIEVSGSFGQGDLVMVVDEQNRTVARGFTNYSADEIRKVMGKNSSEIKAVLGYQEFDEVIHRDNLVVGV